VPEQGWNDGVFLNVHISGNPKSFSCFLHAILAPVGLIKRHEAVDFMHRPRAGSLGTPDLEQRLEDFSELSCEQFIVC